LLVERGSVLLEKWSSALIVERRALLVEKKENYIAHLGKRCLACIEQKSERSVLIVERRSIWFLERRSVSLVERSALLGKTRALLIEG